MKMYILVLFTLTLVLAISQGKDCDDTHYYDLHTSKCMKCKTCKQFEVTVVECSPRNDTVCMSLYDFKVPSVKEIRNDLKGIDFDIYKKKAEAKDEAAPVPDTKTNITNWKTLSYALTAVLGCLAVTGTLILLILWKSRRCVIKQYDDLEIRQGDDTDFGNEYVVFQRIPTRTSYDEANVGVVLPRPIRGSGLIDINVRKYSRYYRKRLYKPIRRLLPEGVDDVFESEDSNGSRTLRLDTIPERSDSDIDDVLNADNQMKNSVKSETDSKKSTKESLSYNNVQNACSSTSSGGNLNGGRQCDDFSSQYSAQDADMNRHYQNVDENTSGSYVTLRHVEGDVEVCED